MTIRKQLIQFACPICDAAYGFLPEKAGSEATCNHCNNNFTVPIGLPARMVDVSTDRGRTLTAEETAEFYDSPAGRAYLASQMPTTGGALAQRVAPMDLIPDAYVGTPEVRYPVARQDDEKDFELNLGNKLKLKTPLDGKTRASVFSTIVGGVLVALGAIIAGRLGVRTKV